MNFQQIRQALKEHNLEVFTNQDFVNLFNFKPEVATVKLSRYKKLNYLISPKNGIYYLNREVPDKFRIANKIYKPSYISLDSALSRHGIIPETVYAITSLTTKATRIFEDQQTVYRYYKIKSSCFTGYDLVNDVYFADPEKAFVDYLYFVSLGKRVLNDRFNLDKLQQKKVYFYASLFKSEKLNNLVNKYFK
jgi:predicted transcriptional regulator of viral defense system